MKTNLYSLFDKKSSFHAKPITHQNNETLFRELINMLQDQNNKEVQFVKNPEDFYIFKLGTYDDNSGEIIPDLVPMQSLSELLRGTTSDINPDKPEKLKDIDSNEK